MEKQLPTIKKPKMKTVFEKVIHELCNIENALNYFIAVADKNKKKRFSRILSNESINLKSDNVTTSISAQKTRDEKPIPQTGQGHEQIKQGSEQKKQVEHSFVLTLDKNDSPSVFKSVANQNSTFNAAGLK